MNESDPKISQGFSVTAEMHLPVLQTTVKLISLRFSKELAEKHQFIQLTHKEPLQLARKLALLQVSWPQAGAAGTDQTITASLKQC